jgi:acyl-CoA thioester hydrolase
MSHDQIHGRFLDGKHYLPIPVYYEDTDAGGVVYYANYLRFAERARTEALRALGIKQSLLQAESGLFFVVTRCEVDFIRPARLDDQLVVETQLIALQKVRMSMAQIIRCKDTTLVKLVVNLAMINKQGKPERFPDHLVHILTTTFIPQGDS